MFFLIASMSEVEASSQWVPFQRKMSLSCLTIRPSFSERNCFTTVKWLGTRSSSAVKSPEPSVVVGSGVCGGADGKSVTSALMAGLRRL